MARATVSPRTYALRGLATLCVIAAVIGVLIYRYEGGFTSSVDVEATVPDVGDGLVSDADVRFNGLIVGTVTTVGLTGDQQPGGVVPKKVSLHIDPDQAPGIPSNVTVRTVPSNLFGINSVELVAPATAVGRLASGDQIAADTSAATLALQDAIDKLHGLLDAVPAEQLGDVLASLAQALQGGSTFGTFVGLLEDYWTRINAEFPDGAPSGFDNFSKSVSGLAQSSPQLLKSLGQSVVTSATIITHRNDLAAMLSAGQQLVASTQTMFARDGDVFKRLVPDLGTMTGALTYDPDGISGALRELNVLASRILASFTAPHGHMTMYLGVSFSPLNSFVQSRDCPLYDGGPYGVTRGPGCTRPAAAEPTQPGPILFGSSQAGHVTTGSDSQTLSKALGRPANTADTLMSGPWVQSVRPADPSSTATGPIASSQNASGQGGG